MDVLALGHFAHSQGQITGDIDALARLFGCDTALCVTAIDEIVTHRVGDVKRHRNGTITLINRRVARRENSKENNKIRQQRSRDNRKRNANVTDEGDGSNADVTSENTLPSSSSSFSSSSELRKESPYIPLEKGDGKTNVRKRKSGMRIDQVPSDAVARFNSNVWPKVRARSGTPKKKQDALLVYAQIDPAEWGEVETAVNAYYSDDEFTKGDGKPVDLVRFLETGKGVETWREWVTVEPALTLAERLKQAKGCDVCNDKGHATIENTTYRCRCEKGAVMWGGKGGQLTEAEYTQLQAKQGNV